MTMPNTKPKTCFVHIHAKPLALHSEHSERSQAEHACVQANLAAGKLGLTVTYEVCDQPFAEVKQASA